MIRDFFPGGPVVETSPSNTGSIGLIPGEGAKIRQTSGPKAQNIKQKQYCNKFNKDFLKRVGEKLRDSSVWFMKTTDTFKRGPMENAWNWKKYTGLGVSIWQILRHVLCT